MSPGGPAVAAEGSLDRPEGSDPRVLLSLSSLSRRALARAAHLAQPPQLTSTRSCSTLLISAAAAAHFSAGRRDPFGCQIIATTEAEMAGVFFAAILFVLDDPVLLALACGMLVAARWPGAARRWMQAAVAAQQRDGSHRAAQARVSGVSGDFGGAARLASCATGCVAACLRPRPRRRSRSRRRSRRRRLSRRRCRSCRLRSRGAAAPSLPSPPRCRPPLALGRRRSRCRRRFATVVVLAAAVALAASGGLGGGVEAPAVGSHRRRRDASQGRVGRAPRDGFARMAFVIACHRSTLQAGTERLHRCRRRRASSLCSARM